MTENLNWRLMNNNITHEDREALIQFLREDNILTQSKQVEVFEKEWSEWLGVKHSVFVNSGASANLLSMALLKTKHGDGEVIVPSLTWISDISSVIQNGFHPVFVDISNYHLGMQTNAILRAITDKTRAVFLTHLLGFNAITQKLLDELKKREIPLIEDCCEAHGATYKGKKVGSYGYLSNFSFYYAHHMSTIEGGMISTNDESAYETLRTLRSHGMVREMKNEDLKRWWKNCYPDVNSDFIFAYPAYNLRSTELNAVIGRNQLKRLDENNKARRKNLKLWLKELDDELFHTDLRVIGSVNYALPLILTKPDNDKVKAVEKLLRDSGVEFRKGLSGGGNQLRQPYFKRQFGYGNYHEEFKNTEHMHFYSWYIGNYPGLEEEKIISLCRKLNLI